MRQVLLSQRIDAALKGSVATEQVGALALKRLTQAAAAFNVPVRGGGDAAAPTYSWSRQEQTQR